MFEALIEGETLQFPTVGTWRPMVGRGAPMVPGMVLGVLRRDGRDVPVHAPARVGGVAVQVAEAGVWVQHGQLLLTMGQGGLGDAPPPTAGIAGGPDGATALCAETDGTVYLRPEPGAAAFAAEGTTLALNDTVALVEVMKTFTPVKAPLAGTVVRVDVSDGEAVTEGQPLVWVSSEG